VTTRRRRALSWRQSSWLAATTIGVAIGLLLAVVFVPSTSDTVVRTGAGSGIGEDDTENAGAAGTEDAASAEEASAASGADGARRVEAGRATGPAPRASADAPTAAGAPIRIGVGVPSLGALAALGPNYDFGDPRAHMAALLAAWKRAGLVPVNGHDVEFVYRTYSIVSADEQKAACAGWVKDDRVFAVFALQYFFADACPAVQHDVPFVTASDYEQSLMDRGAPYLFTLSSTTDRILRNWAHWADGAGLLRGKRIGLYYRGTNTAVPALKQELAKLGATVVEEVTTDNDATGSAQEGIAVQRFRASRVDVAWLVVSAINQTNFMQQAQAQGYRPAYLAADLFSSTTDTATGTYPPDQYEGTGAMTVTRLGEIRAGIPPTSSARFCVDAYARASGREVVYEERPAEWYLLQQNCDTASVVLEGLRLAGPGPSRDAFVAGLERLVVTNLGVYSDVSFRRGKHDGTDQQRTLRWSRRCTCWRAEGAFAPMWVQ
jgi:ABC-type branched-subunit amino acid transport system substrate-binding protein